ncbi:MAG TPA: DUF6220 domain-containing protein [Candidatus Dormibacteraeota bacterium]|nr:DUF6220 domain-containing protein [Candidatus Dormibacteraeota bacterium]
MTSQRVAEPSTGAAGTEAAAPATPDQPAASRAAGIARRVYVIGIRLLALLVVAQFLLAGLGIFFDPQFLAWHAAAGAGAIGLLSLLLVPVGRVGRVPGRTLWLTASVLGLVIVQSLLLAPYHLAATGILRAVSGLHVVNALLIFWVVLQLLARTRPASIGAMS